MTVVNFYNIDASSKDIISVDNYKFDTGKEAENWILGEHYDLLYDEDMLDEKWESKEHFVENNSLMLLESNNELFEDFEYDIYNYE
jgi:hypothetical protein